jgi:hypothetical protein
VSEQIKASQHRLDDAQALFDAGRWRGSMYMAGYSLECLLKAKLMQRFRCRTLDKLEEMLHARQLLRAARSVYTHELEQLLQLLGAVDRLQANRTTYNYYKYANHWTPAWRYDVSLTLREDAAVFLDAVRELRTWIRNNI